MREIHKAFLARGENFDSQLLWYAVLLAMPFAALMLSAGEQVNGASALFEREPRRGTAQCAACAKACNEMIRAARQHAFRGDGAQQPRA